MTESISWKPVELRKRGQVVVAAANANAKK